MTIQYPQISSIRRQRNQGHELVVQKWNGTLLFGYLHWAKSLEYFREERKPYNKPVYVSYHTDDPVYTRYANRLRRSLDALGLEHEIVNIGKPHPIWVHNVQWKARCLINAMDKHKRPVVWLDADSVVAKEPHFFNYRMDTDYMIVRTDRYRDWGNVVYFNNSHAGRTILNLWAAYNEKYPQCWDETILTWAWHTVYVHEPYVKTMFIPSRGPITYGNNTGGMIHQFNASAGRHDARYELSARKFTPRFMRAIRMLDFSKAFDFEGVYDASIKSFTIPDRDKAPTI